MISARAYTAMIPHESRFLQFNVSRVVALDTPVINAAASSTQAVTLAHDAPGHTDM